MPKQTKVTAATVARIRKSGIGRTVEDLGEGTWAEAQARRVAERAERRAAREAAEAAEQEQV